MTFSPFDSPIYSTLYGDPEVRALFTDSAEVRAMLLVEGTLAKVQGELGVIPLESALYIHRASMEVQIDPTGLAEGMAEVGNPVFALVAAFAKAMEAPEHSKYIHWGANAQDVIDTALVLRLRQYIGIIRTRLEGLNISGNNKDTLPLTLYLDRLDEIQKKLLVVRFNEGSGADELAGKNHKIESALADALKLSTPSMESDTLRVEVAEFVSIFSKITKALDIFGQTASETVQSTVLSTMARYTGNQTDLMHRTLEDQCSKLDLNLALEKLVLGQVCIAGGVATKHAQILVDQSNNA